MRVCVTDFIVGKADNELVCQLLEDAILDDVSLSSPGRSLSQLHTLAHFVLLLKPQVT